MTLALLAAVLPQTAHGQWKTHWSYEGVAGPDHWGDLDPAYAACKAGKEQSPIDIRNVKKAPLPALRFEYKSGPLKYLINNGYTIRVNYHSPGSGDFLIVGDQRYQLVQFHFHRPSEIWDHMAKAEGKEEEIPGVAVNPAGVLPRNPAYYMYTGSLTAPPCTEGVTWYVLKTPVEISAAEIDAFAKLYPHDVRPIQALNGRVVTGSQ